MKISVIDVGSNSVRLALFADGKTLYKRLSSTRLGEGLAVTGKLSDAAIERTARAVADFAAEAADENATHVYVFATAAVRSASNGNRFTDRVKQLCGITVDVVSGEDEALLGITGALGGKDGGIIDVGGASTEVTVMAGGKTLYSKSINIGTVRLNDLAGRDKQKLTEAILGKIEEFDGFDASQYRMYGIGGTATTLAAVKHKLKVYDPSVTDGTPLYAEEIYKTAGRILKMPVDEVCRMSGMEPNRADVIGGGCLLTYYVMRHFGINRITVSESDNLEGYLMLKGGMQ